MRVHDAGQFVVRHMYRTVDRESGRVHLVVGIVDGVPVEIDLDQTGRGYFVEHHAVRVE